MTILICILTVVQIAILVQQIMMARELKKLLAEFRSVHKENTWKGISLMPMP